MKRFAASVGGALAMLLAAGATTAHAQLISIGDARVPEGNSGGFQSRAFAVNLGGSPPAEVRVDWQLVVGSAKAGAVAPDNDFVMDNGTLVFPALGDGTEDIPVQVNEDLLDEWSPTEKQDQIFFIQLSNPVGAPIQRGRAMIALLEDDRLYPGLQYVAASASGASGSGSVTLHWRVPAPKPDDVLVRWNEGPLCTPPPDPLASVTGEFYLSGVAVPVLAAGRAQSYTHPSRPLGTKHCYSLFSVYGVTKTTDVASAIVMPRDRGAGPIKWSYNAGSTTLVAATVGMDAVYTVDQSGVVHAMQRGDTGGAWPGSWNPIGLARPSQSRSPVVPFQGGWRLFVATDGGGIHAVDARDGQLVWSRSANFGTALPSQGFVQAPPALLLSPFGGNNDMLLVGSNNGGANAFYAIDPKTGIDQDTYSVPMGDVKGMATVGYPDKVYFLTSSSTSNLYGLDLGPIGTPSLTSQLVSSVGAGSLNSPVTRSGRLFFGDGSGLVQGYEIATTTPYTPFSTSDGPAKGFVWPDRRNPNLYFSTSSKIQGLQDNGGSFTPLLWSPITSGTHVSVTGPSILLQKPGTDLLYFGNSQGQLVQVDLTSGTPVITPLTLEAGSPQIGAPSLDGANDLVIVGSATGTIYAVRVPF